MARDQLLKLFAEGLSIRMEAKRLTETSRITRTELAAARLESAAARIAREARSQSRVNSNQSADLIIRA